VTTNKYIYTSHGIFELKYFFTSGIRRIAKENISSKNVKDKIKQFIAKEDPSFPLTDKQIAQILSEQGIVIARRTVTKYREMLGILPSSLRKQYF
jgi:RNA polymerase sigma-54 factor